MLNLLFAAKKNNLLLVPKRMSVCLLVLDFPAFVTLIYRVHRRFPHSICVLHNITRV